MRVFMTMALILIPAFAIGQTPAPGPGIPLEVAEWRAANISDLRYSVSLSIPSDIKRQISGRNIITFTLRDATRPLVIDFATSRAHVTKLDANGRADFEFVNGHIVVPVGSLARGANSVTVDFIAGEASLNRSSDFLYALFVPARAHLALPCFDQPSLKARWSLSLGVPNKWKSVSNGADIGGDFRVSGRGIETTRLDSFAETEPLSPYLFSFVVGDFQTETAVRNGRTFRMFHRETDAAKVARNKEPIFDLHARAIDYMEAYTGIPYAFGKFDFVLIPAFQFGGMEHAGKILYNAPGLLLEESATQNQQLGRASVIAHETAHMWFGDLVTMRWFNDVWMKEVFANFMAAKIVNPSFPQVNHELRFLLSHYPAAYEIDRTPGANPIRQPLENLNEAGSLYGAIIYQKAPIVMRHLEDLMGVETFQAGLREYLKAHAFGNATWTDLIDVLDKRTPVDLRQWSHVWVEEPGRPTITTELAIADGRIKQLTFRQSDSWQRDRMWPQHLRVQLGYADRVEQFVVPVNGARAEVKEAVGKPAPLYVLPVGGGWAYGGFILDAASIEYLSRNLNAIRDPLSRGAAWVTLWEALLEHSVSPGAIVDLALASVPRETDEQLTQRILGYLGGTWWRFLNSTERQARARQVEIVLREGLAAAKTPSQKSAWFGALRNVALTSETLAFLRRVWEKQETIPGLPLAEPDFTSLALELAVREVSGWREILQTQLTRIENPDRKARFAFVMPALSADPSERERWFLTLKDVANRRREPWVLEGLSFLHHPLRAEASAKYVQASLEMLSEIQKTGDIFFPKRWLDSTLSGHNATAVAATVRAFLAALPSTYPPRLRNIILQSADELFRSAR